MKYFVVLAALVAFSIHAEQPVPPKKPTVEKKKDDGDTRHFVLTPVKKRYIQSRAPK